MNASQPANATAAVAMMNVTETTTTTTNRTDIEYEAEPSDDSNDDDDDAVASSDNSVDHPSMYVANSTIYPLVDNQWCVTSNYTRIMPTPDLWRVTLPRALAASKVDRGAAEPEFEPYENGGMTVPFEIRMDPVKGRGLYATAPIIKGTKVWTAEHEHYFRGAVSYRAFLERLPHPLQCDVLMWTYPLEDTTREVATDFDDGTLFNDGGENSSDVNVDYDAVAMRNISAGEELLQDYSSWGDDADIPWFDEIWAQAWGAKDGVGKKGQTGRSQDEADKQSQQHLLVPASQSLQNSTQLENETPIERYPAPVTKENNPLLQEQNPTPPPESSPVKTEQSQPQLRGTPTMTQPSSSSSNGLPQPQLRHPLQLQNQTTQAEQQQQQQVALQQQLLQSFGASVAQDHKVQKIWHVHSFVGVAAIVACAMRLFLWKRKKLHGQ